MHEEAPSLLHFLYTRNIIPQEIQSWIPDIVLYSWIAIAFLGILSYFGTRNLQKIPRGVQNFLELAVASLTDFCKGILGAEGERFVPFIGSFFLYIFTLNLMGLIPGFKSPTSSLNTTIALAISAIIMVQVYTIRTHGLLGWIKHFWGEPWYLGPLMLPLHIVGEFIARPMSLSLRLFGNIFGEDTVLVQLLLLAVATVPIWLPIPYQLPMMLFGIFTSFLQALVFSMLVTIYISLGISHSEEHAEEHH